MSGPGAWRLRLHDQLPGWAIRWTDDPRAWHAAPAPRRTPRDELPRLPNRIDAATPRELRALARERYGWDDHCGSCGVLARECGHRQPEREARPD